MVWLVLMAVAFLIFVVGTLQFLGEAFKESLMWGLGCLVPFVSLVFLVLYWDRVSRYFFTQLGGLAALGVILMIAPEGETRNALADNPFTRIERSPGDEGVGQEPSRTPFDSVFSRRFDRRGALDESTEAAGLASDPDQGTRRATPGRVGNRGVPPVIGSDRREEVLRTIRNAELKRTDPDSQNDGHGPATFSSNTAKEGHWLANRDLVTAEVLQVDLSNLENSNLVDLKIRITNQAPVELRSYSFKLTYFDRDDVVIETWSTHKTGPEAKLKSGSARTINQFAYAIPFNTKKVKVFMTEATFSDGSIWFHE